MDLRRSWDATNYFFRVLLVPLVIYALHAIWNGPPPQTQQFLHAFAIWNLLVSLGATVRFFYVSNLDVKQIQEIIHTLLAFTVLGVLEPIRQNARRPLTILALSSSPLILLPRDEISSHSLARHPAKPTS